MQQETQARLELEDGAGGEDSRQGGRIQKTEALKFLSTRKDLGDIWSVETVQS